MKGWKRFLAAAALALLSGCGQRADSGPAPSAELAESAAPVPSAAVTAPAESVAPTRSPEELAAVSAAEATLESFRWPEEREVKTLAGREVEFVRYHSPGWTILVPEGWGQPFVHDWRAPSQCAGLSVSRWEYPADDAKFYRAQQGSWRHETDYPAPFDYYYDDDGGYTPPQGSADYVYFFAPAGEKSYELTISGVAGLTTDEEKAILEAMLLSFTQDESSHVLYTQDYTPGRSEWDFAMAALLAESEKLWASWGEDDGWGATTYGKGRPEYVSYALPLTAFQPGEFVRFGASERPEEMEGGWPDAVNITLPDSKLWFNFYEDLPWVKIGLAGEEWWTKAADPAQPGRSPYDAALAWMRAEREWEKEAKKVFAEMPRTWSFLSGAGGWSTELSLDEEGFFTGSYHDSDMGGVGENYPNGTHYYCDFNGRFSPPEQVDEFTYVTQVEEINYEPAGVERIEDGTLFVTVGPHGLEGAKEVRFYRPGYPISNFTEWERGWLLSAPGMYQYASDELAKQTLPFWVIHNVDEGMLFFAN